MTWGEWMVPKPGPEHLLTLEQQRRAIEHYNLDQAKDALFNLCRLTMHQDLLLKAAVKRIASLEHQQHFAHGVNEPGDSA